MSYSFSFRYNVRAPIPSNFAAFSRFPAVNFSVCWIATFSSSCHVRPASAAKGVRYICP